MKFLSKVRSYFQFDERETSFKNEFIGGLVTFLALSYIIVVNPGIISGTEDIIGVPWGGAFLATAIGAGLATIIMGLYANIPVALAPGMGVNAFFIFTIIGNKGYTWQEALAISFIGGLIFLGISFTNVRKILIRAIPTDLKAAIGAGIGFFIALVGLRLGGMFTYSDEAGFALADLSQPKTLLTIFSIILIVVIYSIKGRISKFSFVISILGTTALGLFLTYVFRLEGLPSLNDFNYNALTSKETWEVPVMGVVTGFKTLFSKDILGLIVIIYALLFVDIFDTAGTLVAVGKAAKLEDENGEIRNMDKAMKTDSIGTMIGATLGTPVITSFVESATGVEAGARTGFANIVTGLLFLSSIALFPIFNVFAHSSVTAGALFLVGVFMAKQVSEINWEDPVAAITAFITIVGMIITGSVAEGISFGFIFYSIMKLVKGEGKEVNPIIYGSSLLFLLYYVLEATLLR